MEKMFALIFYYGRTVFNLFFWLSQFFVLSDTIVSRTALALIVSNLLKTIVWPWWVWNWCPKVISVWNCCIGVGLKVLFCPPKRI